jgi:MSHA biogenesis protein MshO
MGAPVEQYLEQARRSELVDASDRVSRTMNGDVKNALPNSVRISNSVDSDVLQLLYVTDVIHYVPGTLTDSPTQATLRLQFGANDNRFQAYGSFAETRQTPSFLVVNNLGTPNADAYENANVITLNAVPVSAGFGSRAIALNPNFGFATSSFKNRMHVVRGPVTYVCNRLAGTLMRFAQHAINANMPVNESDPQLSSAGTLPSVVATGVTACSFACPKIVGSAVTCLSTASVSMTIHRGVAPEDDSINLLHELSVTNDP